MGDAKQAVLSAVFGAAEIRVPDAAETIILNGTGRDSLYLAPDRPGLVSVTVLDHFLRPLASSRLRLSTGCALAIPSGGAAILTRGAAR
jgi:hypothetical protein